MDYDEHIQHRPTHRTQGYVPNTIGGTVKKKKKRSSIYVEEGIRLSTFTHRYYVRIDRRTFKTSSPGLHSLEEARKWRDEALVSAPKSEKGLRKCVLKKNKDSRFSNP